MDVEYTDYALMRMHMRDVLPEEVVRALEASGSKHRNRPDGRSEVSERIGRKQLLVIYLRVGAKIRVINTMWENPD